MTSNQSFFCGVQCVVYDQTAEPSVLLGRRFRTAGQGLWALPGGHVEFNESPIITARRELMEETNLLGVTARLGPTFFTYSTETPYAHVPVIFDDVRGEPRAMPDENFSEVRFFRLDRLPRRMFEPSRRTIGALGSPMHTAFVDQPHASFLKIDMAAVDTDPDRRSFSALLFRDRRKTTLVVTRGSRAHRNRQVDQLEFPDFDEAARQLEEIVRECLRLRYLVTDLSGDLTVDGIHEILPEAGRLRIVSEALIRRILDDDQFRRTFADQFDPAEPPAPAMPLPDRQLVLFDV